MNKKFWLFVFGTFFSVQVNAVNIGQVVAKVETPPSPTKRDVLDNPIVYVDQKNPSASFVLCTNKDRANGGIHVYDLKGREIRFMNEGRTNSIDIRYNIPFGGGKISLVAATHRGRNSITVYAVDPTEKSLVSIGEISLNIAPYGGCLYHSASSQKLYFFVTSKVGDLQQWELSEGPDGRVGGQLVRTLNIGSKSEGCVVNDQTGDLFVAEEAVGIWKYNGEPTSKSARTQVARVGTKLHADVEALALYQGAKGQKYLIASSQGNNSYCIYSGQSPYPYIGSFKIVDTDDREGTEKTDGITVVSAPLEMFPNGVFIAHDNRTRKGGGSNFKFVDWRDIQSSLRLKVAMR
ncbi:MAG: phytase [Verrucomicrobiaceae bacterium]|nr:phytase [Verrucomicrobiaceae bacterium]